MPVSPSRLEEAKQVLLGIYAGTGGMPSIAAFAEAMGYNSTASAYEVTEALFAEGFLRKSPSGRLLPGPSFEPLAARLPAQFEGLLPVGKPLQVLTVPDGSLEEHGILEGDFLVIVSPDVPGFELLVLSKGRKLRLAQEPANGWASEGRLVAQFRSYR